MPQESPAAKEWHWRTAACGHSMIPAQTRVAQTQLPNVCGHPTHRLIRCTISMLLNCNSYGLLVGACGCLLGTCQQELGNRCVGDGGANSWAQHIVAALLVACVTGNKHNSVLCHGPCSTCRQVWCALVQPRAYGTSPFGSNASHSQNSQHQPTARHTWHTCRISHASATDIPCTAPKSHTCTPTHRAQRTTHAVTIPHTHS